MVPRETENNAYAKFGGFKQRTLWYVMVFLEWSIWAVYKSGMGTRGRGHRDACVGTWDLGTRDEGLEDIKYGTRGRVGRGRGDVKNRDAGDAECE